MPLSAFGGATLRTSFVLALGASVTAAAADDGTVIPLRIRENFPLVEVRVGGQKVTLLFDTGDSRGILLDQSIIDRIRAKPAGTSSKVVDVKGNVVEAPRYEIPRLQIGSIVLENVVAELEVHDPSYTPDQYGQQGFLGTGFLKPYQVVIDYPRSRLSLFRPGSSGARAECRGTAVPFAEPWNGEPVTEVDTDLGRIQLWWDTGTPLSILATRIARSTKPEVKEGPMTSRRLSVGGKDFGPWTFEIVDLTLPPGFDGFFGYDFYARHVVCMDFPGKELLVRKP